MTHFNVFFYDFAGIKDIFLLNMLKVHVPEKVQYRLVVYHLLCIYPREWPIFTKTTIEELLESLNFTTGHL